MKRFVVLVFAAALVSYCGTPPPAGTLESDTVSGEETTEDSNAIEIAAVVAGAAVVLCYTVPKIAPKLKAKNINCRALIREGTQKTGQTLKTIGNKITETGRKVGQKIKNLTNKTDDAAKNTDEAGDVGKNAGKGDS